MRRSSVPVETALPLRARLFTSAALMLLVMLLLAAALLSAAAPAFGLSFTVPARYRTGAFPCAVASGDVNSLAAPHPDLVTANRDGNSVTVYLGQSNGRFGSKKTFVVGAEPTDVALADVNADGALDIITANNTGSVSVLLGDGADRFAARADFATPPYPVAVAAADLNGDGHVDLAVVHKDPSTAGLSILPGDGTGAFGSAITVTPQDYYRDVVAGDFNGDKVPDLAVALTQDEWATVGVLLGQGVSGLAPMRSYPTYNEPWALAVGTMNDDYRQDLAVLEDYEGVGNAQVFLGDGLGSFVAVEHGFETRPEVAGLALADFDRDGHTDAATTQGRNVLVLRGSRTGSPSSRSSFPAGAITGAVLAGDFNRDGLPDMAVVDPIHDTVGVLLNGPRLRPVVDSVSPARGRVGDFITITGHHFGVLRGAGSVRFGATTAVRYPVWSANTIRVKVPAGTAAGWVRVAVKTVAGWSAARSFYRQ